MPADALQLTESILALLDSVQEAIDEARERAYDTVVTVSAVRDTLRFEHDRQRERNANA